MLGKRLLTTASPMGLMTESENRHRYCSLGFCLQPIATFILTPTSSNSPFQQETTPRLQSWRSSCSVSNWNHSIEHHKTVGSSSLLNNVLLLSSSKGLGQTKAKKETNTEIKKTKDETWNYKGRIDQDGTFLERKEKANQSKSWVEKQRETKKNLKDVTQEESGLESVRKQQHNRDQNWKETGRQQKKNNTNFDMARSLFGGGGPAPRADDSEEDEVEQVAQEMENTHIEDDDEETAHEEEEASVDEYEPEEEEEYEEEE